MIEIVAYNPDWPKEYQSIAETLSGGLGPFALRIDHIGSTSVPGLAAKDIIDVQITVAEFSPQFEEKMRSMGYTMSETFFMDHRPPFDSSPDSEWEKRFFRPPSQQRPTNTHVRIQGRANQRYALLFRDFLRANPGMASSYAELKRRLAQHFGEDRKVYTEVKDPACDMIMVAAEAWARSTNWQPGE